MLIGNYSVFNKCPGKFRAGTSTCDRSAYNLPGMSRGMYYGDGSVSPTLTNILVSTHFLSTYGIPVGSVTPYSWIIPQVAGGMVMRTNGSSSISFTLIPQQPTSVSFTGSGTLSATASLLISMLCAMSAGGSLTASITGNGNIVSSMTGSGNLTADIKAFGNLISNLLGTGTLTAFETALGNMSIDITVTGTGLSTANVGPAVWAAIASLNNVAGTMGEKLNAAGGAADPLANLVPGSYGPGTAGEALGLITPAVDPWATPLPGAYNSGEAGYILGNLLSNIPDEVWNELKTTHTTASSYGKIIQDLEILAKQIKALTAAQL